MSNNPINPWIKTTCAYCGVGCGVEAKPLKNGAVSVRGDQQHPANLGKLCSKGSALGETLVEKGRLIQPQIDQQPVSWEQALSQVAQGFSDTIAKHGPESVAFYLSGQLLTEDYYVANKLMKGFIGSANVDTNSRLCMSSSVAGHKRAFGTDSMPATYSDIEAAELIILVGSNLAWCHPVLFQRIKAAKQQNPQLMLVVIDPRKTASSHYADLHLPINATTDVLLFNGLLTFLAQQDLLDHSYIEAHTQGLQQAIAAAQADSNEIPQLAEQLGIDAESLNHFFQLFANTEKVLTIYSQGVNQSSQGTDKVNSIINCHLATGKIGKAGCNPFSITGQPNAMGGREVGGLANTLAAHLDFSQPARQLVSQHWQTDNLACQPGLKAVDMFDALADGKIKAIWIMATNPAVSLPNSDKIKQALRQCPLVVVSDCVANTDTGQLATVQLPAQGWAEKSGTVTNSERRISRQRRITTSPGEARPDWWIISEVAKRMGFQSAFNYRHEADIFREYAALTNKAHALTGQSLRLGQLADISDNEYANLPPQQWPVDQLQREPISQHLFKDGQFDTQSHKAQLIPVRYIASQQACDPDYPLRLNNGRNRDQWHTMTRTGLAARLNSHQPEPLLSINPVDAKRYNFTQHDIAHISSASGQAMMRVSVDDSVKQGDLFAPIHWSDANSSAAKISRLSCAITDPVSGQPEMKNTPVQLQSFKPNSQALVVSKTNIDTQQFDYWVRQGIEGGYRYIVASKLAPEALHLQLKSLYRSQAEVQIDAHQSHHEYRLAISVQQELQFAFTVAKQIDLPSHSWFEQLLSTPNQTELFTSLLSNQPSGDLAKGRIICACKQVGENQINNAIKAEKGISLESLICTTQAGSGCGSCISELEECIASQAMCHSH
ncbi:nitrate reductase [Shewanella sp. Isolate11]|uniref:nitrate reductase n=1 Tax=Shewanella sp. Isolate11 TaxID=2908530 RepID=UPI001EFE8529|nr:nitrate reductase [Shewanella sp. Isolate11]MCG9698159.1 nitrate reductase [Shewanella sp. Isolate11]